MHRSHIRHALLMSTRRTRRQHGSGSAAPWFVLMAVVLGVVILGTATVASTGMYYMHVTSAEPAAADLIRERAGGARVYDRNGVLLYQFLNDQYGLQQRVPLEEISPYIIDATLAAEDASFYSNPGINVEGLSRAAIENLRPGDEFLTGTGGSSITQQLVKQLYFTPEERQQRSISRKVKEAILAVEMTQDYDKDQILEWYLNEISYGGVFRGVQAAAQGYFGVNASEVTLGQAAFLAGLPQSPAQYDPFTHFAAAQEKQRHVLDLMVHHGKLDQTLADWAKLEVIELHPAQQPFHAPHFVQYVADYVKANFGEAALRSGGLDIHTTLDLELQWKANATLEKYLRQYENTAQGHNGSVVILDAPTGQILVMVGSRDYHREDIDGSVNNALAENSPGSTLKPFTYATTFMQGWGPEWPIVDRPITYRESDGKEFTPRNPDGRVRGVMPVREALGNSYNIPAFKAILWAGVDNVIATAKAMGMTTLDRQLGPALTLGGVDVKLLDLTYGYSTFANNGMMAGVPAAGDLPPGNRALDPVPVLRIVDRQWRVLVDNTQPRTVPAIAPEYAYMITDILSNDANRRVTYGAGSNLNIPGHRVAVKTGTSEPYEDTKRLIGDTWTVGYTPDIAVGVWVGNTDNTPMVNIFSTTIAGGTWHEVMVEALRDRPARDWVRPDGIVEARVCVPSGIIATPDSRCRSVSGLFAKEALERRSPNWWGGEELGRPVAPDDAGRVPAEIGGWKRYLAEEYLRYFRAPAPARAPIRQQAVPPPAPVAPAPPPGNNSGPGNGNNGNGNGNGR